MLTQLRAWSSARAARYAPPTTAATPGPLANLLALPWNTFDQHLLSTDPQAPRLSPTEAAHAIHTATTDGRQLAQTYAPGADPRDIAPTLGIGLDFISRENRFGSIFQFAEYTARPPLIRIYTQAMSLLADLLAEANLTSQIPDPTAIYIAHEIYHHLDTNRPTPINRTVQVTNFSLGPLRLRSGLISLTEIGACAFAAELTQIPHHPRLLDLLALRHLTPPRAAEVETTLRTFPPLPAERHA